MGFSYDYYGKLKQSKMFLANPQKNYIGVISGAENIEITQQFSTMYELSFKMYENVNGEVTEYYDKIQKPRLIEMQGIGWFQIINAVEKQDENYQNTYKEVRCCMLENALVYRKIYDISGTFSLYSPLEPDKSLLSIICAECGWTVGEISNSLLGLYRTFDISSMQIYNLLNQEIAESFGCVFIFNSYNKTISAKLLSEIGEDTNILISKKNILKEWERDDSDSQIITKLRGVGGDNGVGGQTDFRSVNFGQDYLIDLSYFMTTEWVSQELINSWNNYLSAQESVLSLYNTTLSLLKTKNDESLTLNNQLIELQSNQVAQKTVMGTCVDSFNPSRVPVPSDTNYSIYQTALGLYNTYTTQIALKMNEVNSKKSEITTVEAQLDSISSSVDISNYLTADQIKEINLFITEDEDFNDETYVITNTMSQSEVIDMLIEFRNNTAKKLSEIAHPQYTVNIKASNLFTIQDNKDSNVSFKEWRDKFQIGNIIHIKLRDDYVIEARLMKMTLSYDDPENLELTFSNKSRLDDSLIQLSEIIANAGRTSTAYSLSKFGLNKASSMTSDVRQFINGSLNATLNEVKSNDNQEILIDTFGIRCRKWLQNENKYDNRQMWLNNQNLMYTSDAWNTSSMALGLISLPSGDKVYGLVGEAIISNIIISEKLSVKNSSGTYTITDATGFQATSIVGGNTYTLGINPSTPSEIFKIAVNGSNKLYVDTVNNQLVMNGYINATGGTLGSLTVNGTLSGGTIDGSAINTISGNIGGWSISSNGLSSYTAGTSIKLFSSSKESMRIDYAGLHVFDSSNTTNEYLGGVIATNSGGLNGVAIAHATNAEYLAFGSIDATSPTPSANIDIAFYYNKNDITGAIAGVHFNKKVFIGADGLHVGGNILCSTLNN